MFEVGVIGIEPLHRPLERAPGIEATGPWGAVDVLLSLAGGFVEFGPVGCEKGEVGQKNTFMQLLKLAHIYIAKQETLEIPKLQGNASGFLVKEMVLSVTPVEILLP